MRGPRAVQLATAQARAQLPATPPPAPPRVPTHLRKVSKVEAARARAAHPLNQPCHLAQGGGLAQRLCTGRGRAVGRSYTREGGWVSSGGGEGRKRGAAWRRPAGCRCGYRATSRQGWRAVEGSAGAETAVVASPRPPPLAWGRAQAHNSRHLCACVPFTSRQGRPAPGCTGSGGLEAGRHRAELASTKLYCSPPLPPAALPLAAARASPS